ncbi:YtkA-like protein [Thermolongibacillus altinsuensis]|jgi:hypothetical protein|uniref:YtkA-like protein n=1 Tax=Thermolongibacillus altinsuensis TaxID=575256 RepID=A0A4R1QCC3_9BACL|nr:FixH family protein [Thermolongibacillus altinsuensis]TCL48064.1 YtkA-like protein [Thermolongibacillus altinsuensis]GMB09679.1 hypothetical protein B1no1_23890 [Thermolongibacillus altinsuensis]
MRKILVSFLIYVLLLTGCANGDWEVSVKTKPFYKEGVSSPFIVEIKENGRLAKKLTIRATFEMVNMDHGKIEIKLKEKSGGIYEGKVQLPMEGDWEVLLHIQKGKKTAEKLIKLHVKKEDAVAKINGKKITMEEIRFYQLFSQLNIAISKEMDKTKYNEKELKEKLTYWERQEKYVHDVNSALTHLIELHSIALLAKEKGHLVTKDEVERAVSMLRRQYEQYKIAEEMIKKYGEEKFWDKQKKYSELTLLVNKVYGDIVQEVKKANPNAGQTEIHYLAQKQYEDLLISQIDSLHIELFASNMS